MRPARDLVAAMLTFVLLGGCGTPQATGPAATASETRQTSSLVPRASLTPSPSPSAVASPSTAAAPSDVAGSSPVPGAVWVPGTHVSIVPPAGFEPTTESAGFRDPTSDAVLSIQELAGLFDQSDATYARGGLVVDERSQTTVDGQVRIVVRGVQTLQNGSRVGAILMTLGSEEMSALVIAHHPRGDADAHAAIAAAIETVRLDPTRAIEPGPAIAFDMTPVAPLRLAGMLGRGAVYNTLGRLHHPLDAAIPTMNVYVYPDPPPEDAAAFLRSQLDRNGQQLFDPQVQLAAGVLIDGLEGFQIVASALDALESLPGDREVVAYQVFVPGLDSDRYVYMSAIATADVRDELLPVFRDTALSFAWRKVP